nr:NAD(P)/FAD-dependent oxidoreductase [Hyphobacterium indicum]
MRTDRFGMEIGRVECLVVGAGVIGLAIARRLARGGQPPLVVEKAGCIGSETSSRNSEVIHAGLYYPPDSLKARLCVEGREALYAYCETNSIPHRQIGKLIIAGAAHEIPRLEAIAENAQASGAGRLERLDLADIRRREPALRAEAALFSPRTGIIDSHALMLTLQGEAEAHGAQVVFNTRAVRAIPEADGYAVEFADGSWLKTRTLVNSAGLFARDFRVEGLLPPALHLAKGSYFTLDGRSPFSHLIYPIPPEGGLGIHLTLDLAGQARFGPDVEWVDEIDYAVEPGRRLAFAESVQAWWPALDPDRLQPGYSGIRPKRSGPGTPPADFAIEGAETHGLPGLVQLFGMESPGLTACLAVADAVAKRLETDDITA